MKTRPVSMIACLVLATAVAASAAPSKEDGKVLAKAGKITVSTAEFLAYVGNEVRGVEVKELSPERRRGLLERLLLRKAMAAKGVERGLEGSAAFGKAMQVWKLQNYPSYYLQARVESQVKVSDAEIRERVQPQDSFLLSIILVPADEEGEAQIRKVHGILSGGMDFEQVARQHSTGLSASKGGDIGWQPVPSMSVDEKTAAIMRLTKDGAFMEPVLTPVGWAIFQVRGRRTADDELARGRAQAESDIRGAKTVAAISAAKAALRAKAVISYPARKEGAPAGAPLAVIDGVAIHPQSVTDAAAGGHDFSFKNIRTPLEAIEKYIDAYLLVRETERSGLDKDPALANRYALARVEALASLLLDQVAEQAVPPTEAEVKAEYQRYYQPDVYSLEFIKTTDRATAEKALGELVAGKGFGETSKKYSLPRLAATEGKVSPMVLADFPPRIREAVTSTRDGDRTGIIEDGEGAFLIIKRIGTYQTKVPPLEEVQQRIRRTLELRRKSDLKLGYAESLRKDLKPTIDDKALSTL